jgi:hypothetical protein
MKKSLFTALGLALAFAVSAPVLATSNAEAAGMTATTTAKKPVKADTQQVKHVKKEAKAKLHKKHKKVVAAAKKQ